MGLESSYWYGPADSQPANLWGETDRLTDKHTTRDIRDMVSLVGYMVG